MSASLVWVGILQTVVYLLFIRAIDLYEREQFKYVVPVFIWGFSVAFAFSYVFNTVFISSYISTFSSVASVDAADIIVRVMVPPAFEECIKGLALLIAFAVAWLVSLRRGGYVFSGVMDGIVYGSAVGFGFSIAEDLLYGVQYGEETFVMRRISIGFLHAAFTSLTGIGIGLIPWVRWKVLKVFLPLLGLSGAILLHGTYNLNLTVTIFEPLAAYAIQFFVLVLYILIIVSWLAVERRTIRGELRDEVAAGTISADEYAILPTYFARRAYYFSLLRTGRLKEWRRARKRHEAAVDLAFTKRLSRHSYAPPQRLRIQFLRRRIGELKNGQALQV